MDFETFARTNDIRLVVLFGSQASGKTHGRSDVDIAVVAEKPLGLADRSQFAALLAAQFGFAEDDIDLVDFNDASPLLQFQITEHGKLLWGNPADFLQLRVLAWRRYLDTAKLRKLRERSLAKQLHGSAGSP